MRSNQIFVVFAAILVVAAAVNLQDYVESAVAESEYLDADQSVAAGPNDVAWVFDIGSSAVKGGLFNMQSKQVSEPEFKFEYKVSCIGGDLTAGANKGLAAVAHMCPLDGAFGLQYEVADGAHQHDNMPAHGVDPNAIRDAVADVILTQFATSLSAYIAAPRAQPPRALVVRNALALPAPATAGMRIITKADNQWANTRWCGKRQGNYRLATFDSGMCGVISGTKEALFEYKAANADIDVASHLKKGDVMFNVGGASAQLAIVLRNSKDVAAFKKWANDLKKFWVPRAGLHEQNQFHTAGDAWFSDFVAKYEEPGTGNTIGLISFLTFGKAAALRPAQGFTTGGLDKMLDQVIGQHGACSAYCGESGCAGSPVAIVGDMDRWVDCKAELQALFGLKKTNPFFAGVKNLFTRRLSGYRITFGTPSSGPGVHEGSKQGPWVSIVTKLSVGHGWDTFSRGTPAGPGRTVSNDESVNFTRLAAFVAAQCGVAQTANIINQRQRGSAFQFASCIHMQLVLDWKDMFDLPARQKYGPARNGKGKGHFIDWPLAVPASINDAGVATILTANPVPVEAAKNRRGRFAEEFEEVGSHQIRFGKHHNYLDGFKIHYNLE